jgi:hypothetical protein
MNPLRRKKHRFIVYTRHFSLVKSCPLPPLDLTCVLNTTTSYELVNGNVNIFGVKKKQRELPTYPSTPIPQTFTQYPLSKWQTMSVVSVLPKGLPKEKTLLRRHPSKQQNKKVGLQNSSLKITRTAC